MTILARPLTESEYEREAKDLFWTVFQSEDPYGEPLSPAMTHRVILCPYQYELEPNELRALAAAIRAVGDSGFYYSVTERPSDPRVPDLRSGYWHWYVPLEDLEAYHDRVRTPPFENALYSPTGQWGIIFSDEQHAVVGGNRVFIDTLLAGLSTSWEEQAREFVDICRYWRDHYHTPVLEWLQTLLVPV